MARLIAHGLQSEENAVMISDPDHSDDEDRFIMLGLSVVSRILVVIHCYRADDKIIRIISARKATKKESTQYRGDL
ncbi:MAG: BrnT family toxin [Gammaproteobacteria bacterium]|nr:BrnT family toxin [Gammaproteobacteria bacterium]